MPEPVETKSEILSRHKQSESSEVPQVPIIKEKLETHSELMLEPKSEYVDEMNEDSIEDLTLDDDDISNMEQMDDGAGPSHGNAGEGSSQGKEKQILKKILIVLRVHFQFPAANPFNYCIV